MFVSYARSSRRSGRAANILQLRREMLTELTLKPQ